jgi:hypothetical protein
MSWTIIFTVLVFGMVACPGIVFFGHLRRNAKAKADA